MSYTLLLLRVPPGISEADVERIANRTTQGDHTRTPDLEKEQRKRALVDALLAECPELTGGEPDYAAIARAEKISEAEAHRRFGWWTVGGPDEGSGIEITLYDDYVSIDMPSAAGTKEDWADVWRYLEVLVRQGGFVVWDPQGPNLVDLAAGPFGDGTTAGTPKQTKTGGKRKKPKPAVDDDVIEDEDDPAVEREDARRGGEIVKLINRIVDDAIAAPLAAASFKRTGRTWRRTLDNGLVHVVNVQWSPRDGGVEGVFGLNTGVYSRELAESIALYKPTGSPKAHDCQVQLRAGPSGRSSWRVRVPGIAEPDLEVTGFFGRAFAWLDRRADSKAGDQHAKATRELREALERHALPAFERISTLRGMRDELARSPELFFAAHASVLIGEREQAKQLLEHTLKRSKRNPEYAELVREWGRRQGLL